MISIKHKHNIVVNVHNNYYIEKLHKVIMTFKCISLM